MPVATCTLCEATCGIVVEDIDGRLDVRGDPRDPMSQGYVCPKVVGMVDLHVDPDRLRTPLIRDGSTFRAATWDEALDRAATILSNVRRTHGRHALAVYQGNPTAHNLGLLTMGQAVLRTLGTRNLYSASTADQVPHMRAAHEMFGHVVLMPVPDVDRTEHLLILGGNPLVSNGSVMTAPDFKRRMAGIRARGGRIVVVDPRRTETARAADEHVFIRPGTDAAFLLSLIHTLFEERLARPSALVAGVDDLRRAAAGFAPESTARATGIDADVTRRLARELAAKPRAVAYGRIGVCHQEHGTLSAWLVYALNAISGNIDREGGMMWTTPAADLVWVADLVGLAGVGRFKSRVRGASELGGELPIACLAEEIETEGRDRVRALITSAGNPVLSAPNGRRLERALPMLEAMVSVDAYLNETTRHAHVILPPVSPLQRSHYDLALNAFAVRNTAKYVPPPLPRGSHERDDGEIFLELGLRLRAPGVLAGLLAKLGRHLAPEHVLDLALRTGPHRLSLAKLRESPHGLDLGPLVPRLPRLLRTRSKKIEVAPRALLDELPALQRSLARAPELVLIGRRHLRSNNSWMHNSARLVKGRDRCTLLMHPRDAAARGLDDGALCAVTTTRGTIRLPLEVSDEMMPGVVSAPHGFGHHREGTRLSVAAAHAGTSINDITDEERLDRLTGNAAFSGQPVAVTPIG